MRLSIFALALLALGLAGAQPAQPLAPAGAPASLPPPLAGGDLLKNGLPSKSDLLGMLTALASIQSLGASKMGLDLDVTCTPGTLTPSRRAPAVLQWPSARAVLVTAVCVKGNGTDAPCEGAVTASQTIPAYSLPPRWEPSTFITPACTAGIALPFPGNAATLAPTPPGQDGGVEIPLLPPTTLKCDALSDLARLGNDAFLGGRGRGGKPAGCRVSGPLVDPDAAVEAALQKLAEVKGVLGLA